jgi:hypothetical protein
MALKISGRVSWQRLQSEGGGSGGSGGGCVIPAQEEGVLVACSLESKMGLLWAYS